MRQVLFHLPILGLPIFGYGAMLFVAFVVCYFLAGWRAQKEGIAKELVYDMAFWLFAFGILGGRIDYMIQYKVPLWDFFKIWEGGLVFYGSAIGGLVGYCLAYYFVLRKYQISTWKMADIIAPCAAVGLCLGRIGCFLNGCCYGNVACPDCPAVHFPLCSPPRYTLVKNGLQTAAGFALKDAHGIPSTTVAAVEPGSSAEARGLPSGDVIVAAEGRPIHEYVDLARMLVDDWPRGETSLSLTVRHAGQDQAVALPAFAPKTLGLHPTQLYETVSTFLILLLLSAYFP